MYHLTVWIVDSPHARGIPMQVQVEIKRTVYACGVYLLVHTSQKVTRLSGIALTSIVNSRSYDRAQYTVKEDSMPIVVL